jgi:Ca2+-transporting ATPase
MLVAVVAVSLVIGEISTAVIVGLLVVLNIVLDARQELKARAGVRRTASGRTRPCPLQHEPAVAMVPTGKEPTTLFTLG